MPLIEQLAHRDALKEKGKIIGLIGRRTFSSGMMNAYQLRNATHCILMGEPTGGSPNGYGEVRTFTLPNSKLVVQYSTKLFRGVKEDVDTIAPDVSVEADSAAYFAGRDVVLERAIEWKAE
jgi:C-terminal processing protease CtpA/Prc